MTPLETFGGLIDVEKYLVVWSYAIARLAGFTAVFPMYARLGIRAGILRGGVALALCLPLIPVFAVMDLPGTSQLYQLPPILLKEVIVGAVIGVTLGVPIWAAEAAGEILDLQRGVTFADISDPSSELNNNVTGNFFSLLILAIYFASGGLNMTMQAIYDSYALWPIRSFMPILSPQSGEIILGLLDEIFGMGFMLVVPMVIAFLLVDLSLALVARAAPQINIFILSLTVKNLLFALLLVLYAVFLIGYMKSDLSWIAESGPRLERLAPDRN